MQTAYLTVGTPRDDQDLVAALRAGDDEAFDHLLDRHYHAMLHVAQGFVGTKSVAEDVVQETLLAIIQGLRQFEGRSSLKTWMFRILVNRAKTRGARQRRCVTFSCLRSQRGDHQDDSPPPESTATLATTASRTIGPEATLINQELGEAVWAAVDQLPARHRQVLVLRDVEGWTPAEVCDALGLSEANQRILLHRARTRVRALLLPYLK